MQIEDADALSWLVGWYAAQCDGNWEHGDGVSLTSVGNPGWYLRADLGGTALEGKRFETVTFNMGAPDGDPSQHWYRCDVKDGEFRASCGVHDLPAIIRVFRDWVAKTGA